MEVALARQLNTNEAGVCTPEFHNQWLAIRMAEEYRAVMPVDFSEVLRVVGE